MALLFENPDDPDKSGVVHVGDVLYFSFDCEKHYIVLTVYETDGKKELIVYDPHNETFGRFTGPFVAISKNPLFVVKIGTDGQFIVGRGTPTDQKYAESRLEEFESPILPGDKVIKAGCAWTYCGESEEYRVFLTLADAVSLKPKEDRFYRNNPATGFRYKRTPAAIEEAKQTVKRLRAVGEEIKWDEDKE